MKKAVVAVGMLIVVLVVLVGLRAIGGPGTRAQVDVGAQAPPAARPATTAAADPAPARPQLQSVPSGPLATADPDVYAAQVAAVVFGLDTRAFESGDYRTVLLGEADPHLSETGHADLERLLADRLPSEEQWARMRANAQWSDFGPRQVWEPGSWTQVVIAGQAEPGWVVRNVTGVQTTHYTEAGLDKTAVRERSVTIAMRCPVPGAGGDSCMLVLVGGSVLP